MSRHRIARTPVRRQRCPRLPRLGVVTGKVRFTRSTMAVQGLAPHQAAAVPARPRAHRAPSTAPRPYAVPGVIAVFTHEDVTADALSRPARHEDPRDRRPLRHAPVRSTSVRFAGQRVAAVVAESEAVAEEGCRRASASPTTCCPAVFDAPRSDRHRRAPRARIQRRSRPVEEPDVLTARRNRVNVQSRGRAHTDAIGDVSAGFSRSGRRHRTMNTFETQRLQHAHLETHAANGMDRSRTAVSTMRTSDARSRFSRGDALCRALFDLPLDRRARPLRAASAAGFGAKQEMLVEDVVALAVLQAPEGLRRLRDSRGRNSSPARRRGTRCGSP